MSKHRNEAGPGRASLYDEITTKIISELEAGRLPGVQPWGTAAAKASRAAGRRQAGQDERRTARRRAPRSRRLCSGARPNQRPNGARAFEAHRAHDRAIHGDRSRLRQGASRSGRSGRRRFGREVGIVFAQHRQERSQRGVAVRISPTGHEFDLGRTVVVPDFPVDDAFVSAPVAPSNIRSVP